MAVAHALHCLHKKGKPTGAGPMRLPPAHHTQEKPSGKHLTGRPPYFR